MPKTITKVPQIPKGHTPPKKIPGTEFIISIIAFVGAQGSRGATYWEWWKDFSDKHDHGVGSALLEYRGTCTARWGEAQKVGILIPTEARRSQRDSDPLNRLGGKGSTRGSRVFVLREGASVLDWTSGDKRSRQKKSGEAEVLAAFNSLRRAWANADTEKARDRLLLKMVKSLVAVLDQDSKPEKAKAA